MPGEFGGLVRMSRFAMDAERGAAGYFPVAAATFVASPTEIAIQLDIRIILKENAI